MDNDEAKILSLPFKIIEGSKGQEEVVDAREVLSADVVGLARLDAQAAMLLRDIGAVEVSILGLTQQKAEIYQRWQQAHAALMQAASEAALHVGIDPKDTSKGWNLDIPGRQFRRTK